MGTKSYGKSTTDLYDDGLYGGYGKRRKTKTDWAGVSIGDAFKNNVDYYTRIAGQRVFYPACRSAQLKAARAAGPVETPAFQPKVKPQLSPCYTGYPGNVSAWAAIGLTGFLEFRARAGARSIELHAAGNVIQPTIGGRPVDPNAYKQVVEVAAATVHARLIIEDLVRSGTLPTLEVYRLFSAAQQRMRFSTVSEIVDAVVLYGDVLPPWEHVDLHPTTASILRELTEACGPYFAELARPGTAITSELGVRWVQDICRCLANHLQPAPPPEKEDEEEDDLLDDDEERVGSPATGGAPPEGDFDPEKQRVAPLDGPAAPSLFDAPSTVDQVARMFAPGTFGAGTGEGSEAQQKLMEALQGFCASVDRASAQDAKWEDMRSDFVERALEMYGFAPGPIEGNPSDGHEVKVRFGDEESVAGEVFDRPVELSDDLPALELLLRESLPIATALRRTLYPNVEELHEAQRFRTTGSLDPGRLALADFSSVIFRRNRILEKADRRGKPVLLIAADGSGSLNPDQMRMLKLLTAAWLTSTAKSGVQILAGLYHSGAIRMGVSGPLVQWIYHPHKTPSLGRADAARAVVSLPNTGTGAQSDVLSLAFMLEEAKRIARGRMVYLILISDCAWNRSFNTPKTGAEEVRAFFERACQEAGERLHVTLVALGPDKATGFEDLLDKVILVSQKDLLNAPGVAEQIGAYVASCMKERRRFV